ncbi:bifunctional 5,10-methylene-tetrahydrofolate dehydrogenase/5,10-methylene-tetrahydrofolate cyclohydrolase, partial [PVC group bacterium]|nr:bifunctional 5,10-methylene-tetrahydrofolate dehydrogenase/5,10-methylene-tetrahydrofolate cyclohydrolase [PVC group bacterium]
KPLAVMLMQNMKGANATVTVCHSRTKYLEDITRQADILIAAIGRAEMIQAPMVKDGAVVIDVGINRVEDKAIPKGYRIVGDVEYHSVSQKAKLITPVPGGVGPMTIAMLMKNTYQAYKQRRA